MAGRGRPAQLPPPRDPPPSILGRGPLPVAVLRTAEDPLLARRLPVQPSTLALEERLAAQHREIQVLLHDNEQLAASHVALKQDLTASQLELRRAAAAAAETKAAMDAEVRELYERSLKAEAEVRAIEGMRAEFAQVRSDVQKLAALKDDLVKKLQGAKGELERVQAEHKQAAAVSAEIDVMRNEILKGRAAIEFEKKAHADNLEQSQTMESSMVFMAREVEKLRAELANIDKRARAAAAAAAAANPGPVYSGTYGNPEMAYGASSYSGSYISHQVPNPQFRAPAVPHSPYDFQQAQAHR